MDVSYAGYQPGAITRVVQLHIDYYHRHWNFGLPFEMKVASELSEFFSRIDPERDMFLCAYGPDEQLLGSITIDAESVESEGAHLRWFIVSEESTGLGVGKTLISRAIEHCDQLKFDRIYLTTFKGLDAARALYDRFGFKLESESNRDQWNGDVIEQKFVR
jgi:GNAT superfamily N-acetyltransferase